PFLVGDEDVGVQDQAPAHGSSSSDVTRDIAAEMLLVNASSGGVVAASDALRSAPVRRRAGPISATGRLPRIIVTVSPRSTASSRSEKCRDASVAVTVRMQPEYLIIRSLSRRNMPHLAGGAVTRRSSIGFSRQCESSV